MNPTCAQCGVVLRTASYGDFCSQECASAREVGRGLRTMGYDRGLAMVSIEPDDLEGEFIRAPEILAYFYEQYQNAERVHLHAKFHFEQTEARLKLVVREELTTQARAEFVRDRQIEDQNVRAAKLAGQPYKRVEVKLKSPTIGEIDDVVITRDEYAAARLAYIEAECEAKRLKGWCDVGRVKRDMLTNLGMHANAVARGAGWTPSAAPNGVNTKPMMGPDDPPF